jgi:hypothetical protein
VTPAGARGARRGATPDPDGRGYFIGKLMRRARPDDVLSFERYLGKSRELWHGCSIDGPCLPMSIGKLSPLHERGRSAAHAR